MDSKIRLAVQIGIAVLLVVVAATAARGVGNIVSRKVVELTPYETVADNGKVDAVEIPRGDENADVLIYNRNLFNQKSGMEEPEPEPEPEVAEEDTVIEEIVGDGKRPVLTDLRVLLQGTQVASASEYSVAMLMPLDGGSDARMQYVKEGDTLLDEARILKIIRNRVYMERFTQNNRLEYIDTRTTEQDLEESKKALEKAAEKERAAAAAAESAKAAAAAAANKSKQPSTTELVKKVDADTYEVSREAVENIRKNPNSLKNNPQYGALPKVQPVYKNGNIGGFRLLGVENGSIYAQLGLKSGDTIIDVNGQAIEGPQQAMALLDALQPGQNIGLKINRSGQEKTLTFQLK
ncbi:MAG: PDZ domain-containing protein [Proteobacteria bacterium]|nr:PDZ domain-containing protein [Pseudomonadota bacterium]